MPSETKRIWGKVWPLESSQRSYTVVGYAPTEAFNENFEVFFWSLDLSWFSALPWVISIENASLTAEIIS